MDSAGAAGSGGPGSEMSGPIGVAFSPDTGQMSGELVAAAIAGAADIGRDASIVRPGDDQSRLGILLGIGSPDGFLPVFAASPACPRVIWVGEPLHLGADARGGGDTGTAVADAGPASCSARPATSARSRADRGRGTPDRRCGGRRSPLIAATRR